MYRVVISTFRKSYIGYQRNDRVFVGQRAAYFQNAFVVPIELLNPVRGGHAPDARRKIEHGEVQGIARILALAK